MSLRLRMATLNPTVGALQHNIDLILRSYRNAVNDQIDLLILPEVILTGYPPLDLLYQEEFIHGIESGIKQLVDATGGSDTGLLFGSPTRNNRETGRPLYNSALLAADGALVAERHKMLLPNYDVFDEARYFEPARENTPVAFKGVSLGLTVCEDIWRNNNDRQYYKYDRHPCMELQEAGAEIILNLSASPFTSHKPEARRDMLQARAKEVGLPICYSNQSGANTDLLFDGEAYAIQADGTAVGRTELFEQAELTVAFDSESHRLELLEGTGPDEPLPVKPARHFKGLSLGISDYLRKTGIAESALLGLSGGIDSALVATIATDAVGGEQLYGVTMPSEFSSEGSITDSQYLARNLGLTLYQLPIKKLYKSYLDLLNPLFGGSGFGVAEENLQSRTRGVLLMALSNKFGHMLLNTGNKSEMAVGYCTLYGDMNGGLSVIGDLYKTEVYELAQWVNESYYGEEVIPQEIIDKAPSAELRPDQKDEDSLPPYDILDTILKHYVEFDHDPIKITEQGIDSAIVKKVIRLVDFNEHKRNQAPPILKVSDKAFGTGRRWPLVQQWITDNSRNWNRI